MKFKVTSFVVGAALVGFLLGQMDLVNAKENSQHTMMGDQPMMMNMMVNSNMDSMMKAMNSPEGQKMVEACSEFMGNYESNDID